MSLDHEIDTLAKAIHDEDISFFSETFRTLAGNQQEEIEQSQHRLIRFPISENQRQFAAEALGLLAASIYAEQISRNFIISVAELFAPYLRLPQFLRAVGKVMGANQATHAPSMNPISDSWLRQIFVNVHTDEVTEEIMRLSPDEFYNLISGIDYPSSNQIKSECYSAFTDYLIRRDVIPPPVLILEMAANIKSPTPPWLIVSGTQRGGRGKIPPNIEAKNNCLNPPPLRRWRFSLLARIMLLFL